MVSYLAVIMLGIQQAELRAGLAKDVAVLRSAYTQLHPGLYRYNSPKQMDTAFDELAVEWSHVKDLREAYVALSLFTAKVRCGHTYPNFFNQTKAVVSEVMAGHNRVPFHFRWLRRRMIVTDDLTPDHQLPAGTEIRAIDGFAADHILSKLMTVARADGSNDAKRISILEVDGKSKYEAFDVYLPLMFPIPAGSMQLDISRPGGAPTRITVPAQSMEDRIRGLADPSRRSGGDRFTLTFPREGVGLLSMPSWVMYDNTWDWRAYLAQSFRTLADRGARSLVIDLRGNEGGSAVGDELVTYLIHAPVRFDQYKLYTRYTRVPTDLQPFLDTWDRSFDDWSAWSGPAQFVEAGQNQFHRMKRFDDVDRTNLEPKATAFSGKVYVLVDSSNSSATFEFDNMVQSHHLGKLVGEPTGGNLRGINGSAFYFLYLPNSKLEVDLPLVGQFPDHAMPDAGLQPDVPVMPTVEGIAAGRDEVLNRALELALGGRGTR